MSSSASELEKQLDGRVVIVTGAGGPIGRVYARRLLAAGASVVLAELAQSHEAAIAELTASSPKALFVPTDIRDVKQTERMAAQAVGGVWKSGCADQ